MDMVKERGNEEERGGGETKSLNHPFSQMPEGFENVPKEYEEEMIEERLKRGKFKNTK